VSLAISTESCDFKTAEDYFSEAYSFQEKGKFIESIALLDKAIEKDSRFVAAYINRGAGKSTLNDYNGAISDYQKVLEIDPNNTLALFNIANNFRGISECNKAVEFYDKAMQTEKALTSFVDSKNGRTYNINLVLNGEWDYAVPKYEIRYERGLAFYELQEFEKSLIDFQFSLGMNFLSGACHNMIGLCLLNLNQNEKACYEFQKAVKLGNEMGKINLKEKCEEKLQLPTIKP
jgi:Tfp pilus assembly protein PilF